MKNPRIVNEAGGILLDRDDDSLPSLYVDSGDLYDKAMAGEFGTVTEYTPPTYEERLAEARSRAKLSRREFFLGLDDMGIYDTIMAADLPKKAQIELDTATEFDRTWPTLVDMANDLGFTDADLDQLFGINVSQ